MVVTEYCDIATKTHMTHIDMEEPKRVVTEREKWMIESIIRCCLRQFGIDEKVEFSYHVHYKSDDFQKHTLVDVIGTIDDGSEVVRSQGWLKDPWGDAPTISKHEWEASAMYSITESLIPLRRQTWLRIP